ncbi:ATP-binding protein [Conexibacter sp. SYSU D00693]|uniref:ATP-binding protein n=1 Tax=Conexibacter sp. SYSU D00693 TaxID=2812560 RepID=UPI00196B639F|nr:ATP-binding protein [Conexibacter sp. SYSU D00693]
MSSAPLTLEELRSVDLFDELDDEALAQWLAVAQTRDVPAGTDVTERGDPLGVHLLLEGTMRPWLRVGDGEEPLDRQHAPTWIGAVATLTEKPLDVRMEAEVDCRVALLPREDFRRLAFAHQTVHTRVMRAVVPVLSGLTAVEQHRERLASLGTMAAGLAHEMGNPAAAAQRAADQLDEALSVIGGAMQRFVDAGVERDQAAKILELQARLAAGVQGRSALDALDAADAEDELADRLADHGVAEPWRVAEPLAAAGADATWLDEVAAIAGPATPTAVELTAATLGAHGLAVELKEATRRLVDLVGAVKSYSYMDRGELVEVDLHEGLETTLTVLAHKLKHTSIEVVREYARDLPKLIVHGSELNQVWTNLLVNAIQALGERGTITVRTDRDGDCVVVEVSDDGPGIPEDVGERIFDAFFTTKDVGSGTGLGLSTARRIVAERHDGSISFTSRPGATTFTVRLPLRQGDPSA